MFASSWGTASAPRCTRNRRLRITVSPDTVPGWLDCRVEDRLDTGDRTVYLAEVLDAGLTGPVQPLTLRQLLQLAPADKLRQLKDLMTADAAVDAAAIRAWRERRSRRTSGR